PGLLGPPARALDLPFLPSRRQLCAPEAAGLLAVRHEMRQVEQEVPALATEDEVILNLGGLFRSEVSLVIGVQDFDRGVAVSLPQAPGIGLWSSGRAVHRRPPVEELLVVS